MKKPVRIKQGDVWYAKGYAPRLVLGWFGKSVLYSTGSDTRDCLLTTFRRWVRARDARRLQRHRRRELRLAA